MRRVLLALLVALAASGFSCTRNARPPVPEQCNPICRLPCVKGDGDTGVRWAADPTDPRAFDTLAGVVVPALADKLRQCDVRREACVQCLDRLKDAGVTR